MEKVKVVIKNLRMQEIPVTDSEIPLIFHFAEAGLDWMQVCGQKGRCTTCAFEVLEGIENLSPPTESELRYLSAGRLKSGYRLACQACISASILVRVPAGCCLPHLDYSEK